MSTMLAKPAHAGNQSDALPTAIWEWPPVDTKIIANTTRTSAGMRVPTIKPLLPIHAAVFSPLRASNVASQ